MREDQGGFGLGSGGEPVSRRTARALSSSWISHIGRNGLIVLYIALSGVNTMSWG